MRTLNKKGIVGVIAAATVVAIVLLIAPLAVKTLTFMPRRLESTRVQPSYWGLPNATLLKLRSGSDAVLIAWWVPHKSNHPLACGTVLMLNGNMGNITDRSGTAAGLAARGVDAMLFDYRGFGASSGHPTENSLDEDALAAYKQALSMTPGGAGKLVLFAHSLGAVPAVALAARETVGGIILLAPYASVKDAVASRSIGLRPVAWLIRDSVYAPARRAAAIRAPVLVVSGGRDRYVDGQTTDSLFSLFRDPKWRVDSPLATHNGLLADTIVWRNIDQFLARVLPCS